MIVGHNPTLHELCVMLSDAVRRQKRSIQSGLPTAGSCSSSSNRTLRDLEANSLRVGSRSVAPVRAERLTDDASGSRPAEMIRRRVAPQTRGQG